MTLPLETLATGAPPICPECGVDAFFALGVYTTGGGYYVGSACECGPYTRESIYFFDWDMADAVAEVCRVAVSSEPDSSLRSTALRRALRSKDSIRP